MESENQSHGAFYEEAANVMANATLSEEALTPTLGPEHTPELQASPGGRKHRCSDCGQHTATRSCICQFPLKCYCQACSHTHLQRKVPNMHLLVPIHAAEMLASEESVPAFITREVYTNHVAEALNHNLSLVSNAREELLTVCKRLHFELDLYRDFKLQELADIETELKTRIEVALRGIEEIRYLPNFVPKNEPERLILEEWKNSVDNLPERLSLFVSTATVDHLISELPSITHFYANFSPLYPRSSHQPHTYLPLLCGQTLKSLSLTTLTWSVTALPSPTDISYFSAVTLLPSGDIFACGGKTHSKSYLIDGLTQDTTELQHMRLARYWHGILATPDYVLVFGGMGEGGEIRESERFLGKRKLWEDLRPMYKPRARITPCRLYMKVFIAGGTANSFETFSLLTEKFELFGLSSSVLSSTTCISLDSSILIIAKQGLLEINTNYKSVIKVENLSGSDWWSATAPLAFNGAVYLCRKQNDGQPRIYRLNLPSKHLEEVA